MATITTSIGKEYLDSYEGYDSKQVGIGLSNPNIYKTPGYDKKKIQSLAIGLLSEAVYSGFDHDPTPLVLPIKYESQYNTILALNLHYVPQKYRQAIMKFVLESNASRIRNNQSILVDYNSLKRAIPVAQFIIRRYKQTGLRVVETYQLNEIPNAIKGSSRFDNHYKKQETV
jgi:hypothetical protein